MTAPAPPSLGPSPARLGERPGNRLGTSAGAEAGTAAWPATDAGPGETASAWAEVRLSWAPTPHFRRLATVGLVALLVAVATGRGALVALAAVPLAMAAVAAGSIVPTTAMVRCRVDPPRCVEGDEVEVTVEVRLDQPVDEVQVRLAGARALSRVPRLRAAAEWESELAAGTWTGTVAAPRWGRRRLGPVQVRFVAGRRLLSAEPLLTGPVLVVLPQPEPVRSPPLPSDLPARLGDHASRATGDGGEFAGVRPWAPGIPARRVHWPATTRRGSLQVVAFAADRAADVVLVVDACSDAGRAGDSTLDRSLRAASGLARVYLAGGDRVGVVALGGLLRWLPPGSGWRQQFRVAEAVLDVRRDDSFVDPDLRRLPPPALPRGALVVLLSPLLDPRVLAAAVDIRDRGHPVVVVDLLVTEPRPDRRTPASLLALRLWRLDRTAVHAGLAELGLPVVAWREHGLAAALAPLARRPLLWAGRR